MATIQKRKNKNNTYSYRVMIRQNDGFPPSSKTFPTRQEAKEWGQQEEAHRRQGVSPHHTAKHTFTDLVERYVAIVLPTKTKNTQDIRRHLMWWQSKLGKYALHAISPNLIASFRQELAEGLTPNGTTRTPATVNRYLASLSSLFSYGIKEAGWLNDNPCLRVTKLQESKGRDRIATPDECKSLLMACEHSRNEFLLIIVLLAITTGMRQGEILKLSWDCIDLEKGWISIKETKNGRPRTVSLIGLPLKLLRELYLKRSLHTRLLFPAKKRFGSITIRKAWEEALKRAQINDLHFHDLRHLFATTAAEAAGASNLELATAMGHQTLQMLQRYTHMNATITHRLSTAVHQRLIEETCDKKQA